MRILLIIFFSLSSFLVFGRTVEGVMTGIEVLRDANFELLKGKRVGLITNPTGVDRNLKSTVDILFESPDVQLVALYGPEHGVRGDIPAGVRVENQVDAKTGLKVHSLYGKTRKPTPEMLQNVDVLVYDIQDIGCRSYTFISTMGLVMRAAAEQNKEVVILDRPNPLGGEKVEGSGVSQGYFSFVSQFDIPYIYGLTCGELTGYLNQEIGCKLTVIPMQGWKRNMTFADTGLPWVPTSPQIPSAEAAICYPATGIIGEMGFLNIGVGYTLPFQVMAAPWVKSVELTEALNEKQLPGVVFRPILYKPLFGDMQGQTVQGVQIFITDYDKARLSEIQFHVIEAMHQLYPSHVLFSAETEKRNNMFDKVCGTNFIRENFSKQYKTDDILSYWCNNEQVFKEKSASFYLY
ncbi:MAG: DUF1343 domain-containing protein [Paludibacteraceae bacterium]|nr:DUF1343 domain-containing protein [Paludibacteraceae bacterium]